jgi:hypothetical protein
MATMNDARRSTAEFFDRHWYSKDGPAPAWSERWNMSQSIPNHDAAGCYLVVEETGDHEHVLYVGKASQKNGNGSLAIRLLRHVIKPVNRSGPPYKIQTIKEYGPKGWPENVALYTLAFGQDTRYLAPSLESWLIGKMDGLRNQTT